MIVEKKMRRRADAHGIEVTFDEKAREYCAVWRLAGAIGAGAIGAGASAAEALRDLREAVNAHIDYHLRRKLKEIVAEA